MSAPVLPPTPERQNWLDNFNTFALRASNSRHPATHVIQTSESFLRRFLRGWLIYSAGLCVALWLLVPAATYMAVVCLVAGLGANWALRDQRPTLARWLFISPCVAAVCVAPWLVSGIRTPILQSVPTLLLLAGWMLGRRTMMGLAGLFSGLLLALACLEFTGLWQAPVQMRSIGTWWAVLGFNLLTMALVLWALLGQYLTDLEQENQWHQHVHEVLQLSSLVIDRSPVPMRVFDQHGNCVAVNEAYAHMVNARREELLQENLHDPSLHQVADLSAECLQVLATGQPIQRELQAKSHDGRALWLEAHLSPFEQQGKRLVLLHALDITTRHQASQELQDMSFHDGLTGLPNRRLFFEHLRHILPLCQRQLQWGAVIILDLQGFKQLNDTHGHDAGDHVLMQAAERLRGAVRQSDVVARLGSDEFAVVVHPLGPNTTTVERKTQHLVRQFTALLAEAYPVGSGSYTTSVHIGYALIAPGEELDVHKLVQAAEHALQRAKQGTCAVVTDKGETAATS